MDKFHNDEIWKDIPLSLGALRFRYAVSNYGRILRYTNDFEDGNILKGGNIGGYPVLGLRPFGKNKTFYLHKLVGECFLAKQSKDQTYVIHLDYNKCNNHIDNLKFASKREMELHQKNSPYVIEARNKRKHTPVFKGHKLTATDVMLIKKKIFDPERKTRMKIIAKRFGISEMQLYRIKSGENWSSVKLPSVADNSSKEEIILNSLNSQKKILDDQKPESGYNAKPTHEGEVSF